MEARRCNIHGLVAASDGRCVICRRGDDALPKASQALISPTTWLIVGCGVVTGSLMIWGLNRIQEGIDAKKNRNDPTVIAIAEPEEPPPPPSTGWRKRPTPPPPATESAAPTAADDAVALEAEKKKLKITLYGTSWCAYCNRARKFLNENGYRFSDLDIERSPTDKVLLESINPKASIPTFDIDGEVMIGWNPARFDELTTKHARARMR